MHNLRSVRDVRTRIRRRHTQKCNTADLVLHRVSTAPRAPGHRRRRRRRVVTETQRVVTETATSTE
ncbi:hypothetical protein J2Y69_002105 [Microbacterium resistens]|uniref:Uncharacterized protein n=1 Tax=Microbacterium resistens TaxID=156977 RepID=A0ABU1SF57_9MICO|nr:hypothetical protein [Microbacterium resistens]